MLLALPLMALRPHCAGIDHLPVWLMSSITNLYIGSRAGRQGCNRQIHG